MGLLAHPLSAHTQYTQGEVLGLLDAGCKPSLTVVSPNATLGLCKALSPASQGDAILELSPQASM